MRVFLFVCIFSAVLLAVYGAVSIYPADPDHPGHCFSKETDLMEYGEEKTLEGCVRASCGSDGSIQLASCGKIASNCKLSEIDPSKPYPDCCPQVLSCEN